MTSCSNKGAILSFVVYNFITAKICSVYSAFHRRHYGGKKANDNDNDSDSDNDNDNMFAHRYFLSKTCQAIR